MIIVFLCLNCSEGDGGGHRLAQGKPGARQPSRGLLHLLEQVRPRAPQGQAGQDAGGGGPAPRGLPAGGDKDGPGLGHPPRGRRRPHGEREDGEAAEGHGAPGVEQLLEHVSGRCWFGWVVAVVFFCGLCVSCFTDEFVFVLLLWSFSVRHDKSIVCTVNVLEGLLPDDATGENAVSLFPSVVPTSTKRDGYCASFSFLSFFLFFPICV